MAFYYNDNGHLSVAPNYVAFATFELHKELHDTYTYPVEGWYWFTSDEEAAAFFGIDLTLEKE